MRGVILAGGSGSRLSPLTKACSKHLLPVGREPMIYHPIRKLVEAEIQDILVVTGTEHMGAVVGTLGSGKDFGAEFTYRVQDKAGGIAQALGLARGFAQGGPIAVLLGDNIFEDALCPHVEAFLEQARGARILLKQVPDPERFGVAELEEGASHAVVSIEEKPVKPKSYYAVTGIYFYDARVFEIIDTLQPSARGELEITDVNRAYLARGELRYGILEGWWTDAGTFSSLAWANVLVANAQDEWGAAATTGP